MSGYEHGSEELTEGQARYYTPKTEDIRDAYIKYTQPSLSDSGQLFYGDKAEFYRWLEEVKAQAWEEGYAAGDADAHTDNRLNSSNPYQGEPNETI